MAVRKGRFSNKKSDKRWIADDGEIWDSRFECDVYNGFARAGARVRRTIKGSSDTFAYTRSAGPNTQCVDCGSAGVIQHCTYTPDLYVEVGGQAYWVEAKGYFQQDKRARFRDFIKAHRGVDVRFVVGSDHKVGKGRLIAYIEKFYKLPVDQWSAKGWEVPKEWL